MLVTNMEAMAMSLNLRDLALSWQLPSYFDWHSAADAGMMMEERIKRRRKVVQSVTRFDEAMATELGVSERVNRFINSKFCWKSGSMNLS